MTISTRTPDGQTCCPICGCEGHLEPSLGTRDAPCASCGHLLWWCRQHLADLMEVPAEAITPETELEHDLGADSLDIVELVMEVEEHFDVQVPDEEAVKQMRTVADAVRYIQSQTSRSPAAAR
jgi:acyl carrier protein